jgi:thioredoxin 1
MKECSTKELQAILEQKQDCHVYVFTPMCGTCQVAARMLSVIEEMLPGLKLIKIDVNFAPELAKKFTIESVPCLLIIKNGMMEEKIYAFRSVPYLYEKLKRYLPQTG